MAGVDLRGSGPSGLDASSAAPAAEARTEQLSNGGVVGYSVYNDTSPALRDMAQILPQELGRQEDEKLWRFPHPQTDAKDTVIQSLLGPLAMPAPIMTFEGIPQVSSSCGCLPPDTNGDVGPNHFVQTVNTAYQIWNKSGVSLLGPAALSTLWTGMSTCAVNHGDPVVLYDEIADRWFISQFRSSSPYGMCIAISTSPDPTGSYHRYFFQHSTATFYDYEKYGVWPDGYYMSANKFGSIFFEGTGNVVYERDRMLQGLSARFVEFGTSTSFGSLLPSDLDGPNLPPAGAPNAFVNFTSGRLNIWRFHVDWANTANSSFTGPTAVTVAAFDSTPGDAPQPGTSVLLDVIPDRLMFRHAYRNLGTHEATVVNHSVDVGSNRAGVRWYELRNLTSGTPSVFQQGTYAPADGLWRWMGSAAMDQQGNIAVGYSAANASNFASIRYAGRLATDPLGQLSQGETVMTTGGGSQTHSAGRWGDYSSLMVDPVDDCTFWYTTEYHQVTSSANWRTRVGTFKFPGCGGPPPPTSTPTPVRPTPTPTNTPVPPTPTNTPHPPTNTPTPVPPNPCRTHTYRHKHTCTPNTN
jgi:hypothetical protein